MWITALPPAPQIGGDFVPGRKLPPPGEFAKEVTDLADEIRSHRFPIFGATIDAGPEIRWRRDYRRGIETDLVYFRRVPYLDTSRAGDHKIIWELNRHQHLVVLAQAYLLTGDLRNPGEICAQLESWIRRTRFIAEPIGRARWRSRSGRFPLYPNTEAGRPIFIVYALLAVPTMTIVGISPTNHLEL